MADIKMLFWYLGTRVRKYPSTLVQVFAVYLSNSISIYAIPILIEDGQFAKQTNYIDINAPLSPQAGRYR